MIALTLLLGVVLVVALVWKTYQLVKAPHDDPLRAVTLCLACASLAFPFGMPAIAGAVDAAVGHGTAKLLQNVLLLGTVYCLMCFYLYSATDRRRGRVRARRETVPLAFTIAAITLLTVLTPERAHGHVYATADMRVTHVALFYLTAGLYLDYALASAFVWTWRYARASRRPLSTGLWLAAAAMAGMVISSAARAVFIVVRWNGGTVSPPLTRVVALLLALSIPLFVVGVTYPGIATRCAALRVWWQHRRNYHRLRPLWLLLHDAYPQDALHRVPTNAWRDALRVRSVHRSHYRRAIECRDGLVRISPYLARLGLEGEAARNASPEEVARKLRIALKAYDPDDRTVVRAVPVAMPDGEGLDADVRQLVALSDALRATS
ncbi:MAB_1171c family putative transporter [Streptomyces sp. NPDC053048]|uniref:MAB_1171c family putative transporter n=1 Tax=Streptomyces sp. NPDC053048 TaxID=3365694 RepID=UPI0037CFFD66